MQPSWLLGGVWVLVSLGSLSVALAVVYYNTVIVLTELALLLLLRKLRHSLRWISLPFPSRWAHKRAIWKLKQRMQTASSFEHWLASARELDDLEGGTQWRAERASDDYDVDLIEDSVRRLRSAREQADYPALMLALRACVHRGYGGITGAALFQHAYTGTKVVLETYVTEICASIETISYASALPLSVRCAFMDALRVQLGRTALALSGGGSLALAHLGVVRTLLCAGLLPRVISGTSGGALVAGMMASRTDQELLEHVLVPGVVLSQGPEHVFFGPPLEQMLNFVRTGRLVNNEKFIRVIRAFIGEDTFLQAWARTGRIVNISVVCRAGSAASYNLQLNYLTTPQVLIWSAVSASCALPGLMHPVMIMACDDAGRVLPYHTQGLMTVDGSMAVDVPRKELALLFHVDTLLVSQANPHVVPFLKLSRDSLVPGGRSVGRLDANIVSQALAACTLWLLLDIRHRIHLLAGLRLLPRWFGEDSGPLFAQSYTGDVTFVPHQSPLEAWRALTQPTVQDMTRLILDGQRATWPHLARVRTLVAVERKLSLCARQLAEQVGMQVPHVGGGPTYTSGRIPRLHLPVINALSTDTSGIYKPTLTPKPVRRLHGESIPPLVGAAVEDEERVAWTQGPLAHAGPRMPRMARVHSYSVPSPPGVDMEGIGGHPLRGPGTRGQHRGLSAGMHAGGYAEADNMSTRAPVPRIGAVDAELLRAAGALPVYPASSSTDDAAPLHSARTSIDHGHDSVSKAVMMAEQASSVLPTILLCDAPGLSSDFGWLRGSSVTHGRQNGEPDELHGRQPRVASAAWEGWRSGLSECEGRQGEAMAGRVKRRPGLGDAVVGLQLPSSQTSPSSASSASSQGSSGEQDAASAASLPASPCLYPDVPAVACPITLGLPLGPSDTDLPASVIPAERRVHAAPARRQGREQHSPVLHSAHGGSAHPHRPSLSLKSVQSSSANLFAPDALGLGLDPLQRHP